MIWMLSSFSYDSAKALLSDTKLLAPAYFILGGNQAGQACIITRSRTHNINPLEWALHLYSTHIVKSRRANFLVGISVYYYSFYVFQAWCEEWQVVCAGDELWSLERAPVFGWQENSCYEVHESDHTECEFWCRKLKHVYPGCQITDFCFHRLHSWPYSLLGYLHKDSLWCPVHQASLK